MRRWVLHKSFIWLNLTTNNTQTKIEVFDLSNLCRTRHLDLIKDIKQQYVSHPRCLNANAQNQTKKTGICISTCNKEKQIGYITIMD